MIVSYESLLNLLLARAFLDIRIAANQGEVEVCFALSDLFHNVPYQMKRVRETNGSYIEVIEWLRMRAKEKKISKWLEHAIAESEREMSSL